MGTIDPEVVHCITLRHWYNFKLLTVVIVFLRFYTTHHETISFLRPMGPFILPQSLRSAFDPLPCLARPHSRSGDRVVGELGTLLAHFSELPA